MSRKEGLEQWVYVHVEIQGQREAEFPERVFVYNYRLYDRYRARVASLCVLADENEHWRPEQFSYELWGCEVGTRFPVVKFMDYRSSWEALDQATNPFAVVVMAHLKALDTRGDADERSACEALPPASGLGRQPNRVCRSG